MASWLGQGNYNSHLHSDSGIHRRSPSCVALNPSPNFSVPLLSFHRGGGRYVVIVCTLYATKKKSVNACGLRGFPLLHTNLSPLLGAAPVCSGRGRSILNVAEVPQQCSRASETAERPRLPTFLARGLAGTHQLLVLLRHGRRDKGGTIVENSRGQEVFQVCCFLSNFSENVFVCFANKRSCPAEEEDLGGGPELIFPILKLFFKAECHNLIGGEASSQLANKVKMECFQRFFSKKIDGTGEC